MKKIFLLIAGLGAMSLQAQKQEVSKTDMDFAQYAMMENMMEVKMGELAMTKGFSPEVKELAEHMRDDHKKADDLLKQVTTARSIGTVTKLDDEHQKEYDKLSGKVGEDFDMSYTECVTKNSKKAIEMYDKESKKGENTELRAFANNTLPGLNHHRDMAEETAKKLKKK